MYATARVLQEENPAALYAEEIGLRYTTDSKKGIREWEVVKNDLNMKGISA